MIAQSTTRSDDTTHMGDQDQTQMPYLESLLAEKEAYHTSFHMPGHKMNMKPHPMLEQYWGGNLHPADVVEINGIIDYLHSPKGALLEAQKLAAKAYGADHTFFLINGSTVGNMGAIMSASGAGQKVIMPRACHRSVYGGLVLSGAMPVYVKPDYHPQVGSSLAVSADVVRQLFAENNNIAAIHITSPNYYGILSDTATIAQIAHEHGALLLVDEAHGSHLAFHEGLPQSATRLGADMVIQSTHKTQGALTQASMLHVNNGRANLADVAQVMGLLQSSSPNSLLLASLDAARMQMATEGHQLLSRVLELSYFARENINAIDGLWCYGDDLIGSHGIFAYDPTKLVIRVRDIGQTGFAVAETLRKTYGIDVEFADLRQIICSITIGDDDRTVGKLISALREIAKIKGTIAQSEPEVPPPAELPHIAISPREAYFANSRPVPLAQSVGEICAENIIPYPPGIPLVVPGEVITQEILDYLGYLRRMGSGVVGVEDKTLTYLRVVTN
ncbi:MAG: aminotransferase class I/II-fold pyridoxal phosphate-dependent enzyme [Anaerolineae bacterium]|nr:aminotransferase class I/II-fold pyridoxal phosphate-dependent enzyme [Anaerolineae bacterium]